MKEPKNGSESPRLRRLRRFSTKELALISVLSSLWIVLQIYLGPVIGQITGEHGVIQRLVGWFLMLALARLTGKFGRVSVMAAVSSSATRIIRPGPVYALFVGLGYAIGGVVFDLLYFLPAVKNFKGKTQKAYLLSISFLSGAIALIPYLLYRLSFLGFLGFIIWIPWYVPDMVRSVALSILGTLIGISVLPQIDIWTLKVRETKERPS